MVMVKEDKKTVLVDVLAETRAPSSSEDAFAEFRRVTVNLPQNEDGGAESIHINHGNKEAVLSIDLNRTIRVPDNNDTNMLPPSMGRFPLFKVQDYAHRMPDDMAQKGGLFFPMYQCEAMWMNFSAQLPFAIKIYVGGVNAVSGLPMQENDMTREKRLRMLKDGKQIQDYMVVPGQPWLDGIVSDDGNIRQFIAKPKGSGFSVEAQVTGEEKVGGIQIEVIPIKHQVPQEFDVRYENEAGKVIKRSLNLADKTLGPQSTWLDVKNVLRNEFDIAVKDQILASHPPDTHVYLSMNDEVKLGDSYFKPNFTILLTHTPKTITHSRSRRSVVHDGNSEDESALQSFDMPSPLEMSLDMAYGALGYSAASPAYSAGTPPPPTMAASPAPAAAPGVSLPPSLSMKKRSVNSSVKAASPEKVTKSKVKEMGLSAGGFIQQTIEPDRQPAEVWDIESAILLNIQILDAEAFSEVTGLPPPPTPISAATYASYDYPFFEIWGEEKTGIKGDFSEVKSVAQIEAERAKARGEDYKEEESVPQRVRFIGKFQSTFRPVEELRKELAALQL
ncbi:hypothetical protein BX600DRAFT_509296 [Xylariales sp. PMI_506]|nr:hypothetical protein BX600DRAFT_509296 [Xylariales sp. PMI_506]